MSVKLGPINEKDNKVYTFSIKKTCHMINPEKSYHKVIFYIISAESITILVELTNKGSG